MMSENTDTMKHEVRGVLVRWTILLVVAGLFAIWATYRMSQMADRMAAHDGMPATAPADLGDGAEREIAYWTCSMHRQVKQETKGDCPICGMELIPEYENTSSPQPTKSAKQDSQAWYRCTMPECGDVGSSDPESRCPVCGMKREQVDVGGGQDDVGQYELRLSERARRLAEVETQTAEKRLLFKRIRTVGRVGYDETRHKVVSAWIGGRIDKLFADFTGMTVAKGDHLVEIYSPELLSAQEGYLQALRASDTLHSEQGSVARRSSDQILRSARRKLELLGITDQQIDTITASGEPQTHLVVHAPIGGTIVQKHAMEGMYVDTGDKLYTIADLMHLWVLVDLYEADLPWIHPFQEVEVTTRSLPGEVFSGEIVFVNPQVNPKTRTVAVRIHVDNPSLYLKPDMWVTAEINAALGERGRGTVPAPGGDYACPMHPWAIDNSRTRCPICEMSLVPVEELPQYRPPTEPAALLSVSRGAVMQTGERALVYVETAPAVYRGAEVELGPLAHDTDGNEFYPILEGLRGGEQVVVRGNFAIDSQMQLAGKPSLFVARGLAEPPAEDADRPATQAQHAGHGGHAAPTTTGPAADNADPGDILQTVCPVMGGEINPEVYTDLHGVRVYFCCPPCIKRFRDNPQEYMDKLPEPLRIKLKKAMNNQEGDDTGDIAQTVCPVMGGEINPEVFTDLHGVRVYFCCPPCIKPFRDSPQEYVDKLPDPLRIKLEEAIENQEGDHD
jgi:Cu(I)/Ag(I) efflux system membrane fusion protein